VISFMHYCYSNCSTRSKTTTTHHHLVLNRIIPFVIVVAVVAAAYSPMNSHFKEDYSYS